MSKPNSISVFLPPETIEFVPVGRPRVSRNEGMSILEAHLATKHYLEGLSSQELREQTSEAFDTSGSGKESQAIAPPGRHKQAP